MERGKNLVGGVWGGFLVERDSEGGAEPSLSHSPESSITSLMTVL